MSSWLKEKAGVAGAIGGAVAAFVAILQLFVAAPMNQGFDDLRDYIDQRFVAQDRRFDAHDERLDRLEVETARRFDAVDARFDQMFDRLDRMQETISSFDRRVSRYRTVLILLLS